MDRIVGQIKEGFAKAVQQASNSIAFTELPNCESLESVDRISIKLKDNIVADDLKHRIIAGHHVQTFENIPILIRNEDNNKQTFMLADLSPVKGISISTVGKKDVMIVRTPNHSTDSKGKIMHPTQATLYKLVSEGRLSPNWWITKTKGNEGIIKIEKVFISLYPIGKYFGFLNTDCVYWFKKPNGSILGYIRPKLSKKHSTLIVKFMKHEKDQQLRAAMLGTAVLFFITEAYPHLSRALKDSIELQYGYHENIQ
uniref:Transmembrane protein n=1 Tax=Parastrongyloides trichosuri TaxID=131310 RepID=A0A0N4ZRP0_PARTI